MKINEQGVLSSSYVYFQTASEAAKRMYFYLRCTGRYQCDEHYAVDRQSYNSFLILYVVSGKGYAYSEGKRVELAEGCLAILDCYQPHRYGSDYGWEILWVHFDGVLAREYFNAIVQNKNQLIQPPNPYSPMRSLEKIYRMFHHEKRASEPLISKYITSILTEFITFGGNAEKQFEQSGNMEEILTFITENIERPLPLEELARKASLSPFYFTRVFKKETGYTPHEYLIIARVNAAKFYLKTTALPIKEIAFRCGFSSECSFCTTFKRVSETTPLTYRNNGSV